jgi:hypothetical protein
VTRHLPIVIRAYTEREFKPKFEQSTPQRHDPKWPPPVLVFDTETTIDPTQRLLFRSYRYGRWNRDKRLLCVEEGLFYADELPVCDPEAFAVLQ